MKKLGELGVMRVRRCCSTLTAGNVSRFNSREVSFGGGIFAESAVELCKEFDKGNNNISRNITKYIDRGLLQTANHPLQITKSLVFKYFQDRYNGEFKVYQGKELRPLVSSKQAFDDLLIPENHVCRNMSDTFYYDKSKGVLLRSQGTCYQSDLFRNGVKSYLVAVDVFRRDEIDKTHYPVFHQLDCARVATKSENSSVETVVEELQECLVSLMKTLLGQTVETRWVEGSFPFTEPSMELEVKHRGEWLEILGAGVVHREILARCGLSNHIGWAFGLGIERLAMLLFDIPDVRLFWTQDKRFISQFKDGKVSSFVPYSKYPPVFKDISFFLPQSVVASPTFEPNDFFELVRSIGGDFVEQVQLIDTFKDSLTGKESRCYRITYRAMDRSLTNQEIDVLQSDIRNLASTQLGLHLR